MAGKRKTALGMSDTLYAGIIQYLHAEHLCYCKDVKQLKKISFTFYNCFVVFVLSLKVTFLERVCRILKVNFTWVLEMHFL